MPEVKQQFTVADETDDHLWLHIEGDESKIEVPVPKRSRQYPTSVSQRLAELERGEDIIATLVNENDQNTAWRVKDLQPNSGTNPRKERTVVP